MKNIIKKWLGITDLELYVERIEMDLWNLEYERNNPADSKKSDKKVAKKKVK